VEGYRPEKGQLDRKGDEVEDRIYNTKDFDRTLVLDDRTKLVAKKVTEFLNESGDRFQKAIIFCSTRNTRRECARRSSTRTPISARRTIDTSCASPAAMPKARRNSTISSIRNRDIRCWSPRRAFSQPASMRRPAA